MTSDADDRIPPVLVLGIGNSLLADDGVGLELLEALHREVADDPRVELVDGGTQGLMLVGLLEGRRSLLLLDAVRLDAVPGHVHHVRDVQSFALPRGFGAHGGNASELLASAALLGVLPERVELVGIEPAEVCTRIGLSVAVQRALPAALDMARAQLAEHIAGLNSEGAVECTS